MSSNIGLLGKLAYLSVRSLPLPTLRLENRTHDQSKPIATQTVIVKVNYVPGIVLSVLWISFHIILLTS